MLNNLEEKVPKFYGSVTVGERGQVAIPAEARRDIEITPATKLLVFGGQGKKALVLMKVESVTEFLTTATTLISRFEQTLKANPTEISEENR